ncbi:MAG: FAD-dependent oxidoreductase [Saprospiraceae bacterium]|nr:FAD-dependent oxidoreductase [Saprospiraceae bacterium]MCB9318796.1 FAD-dependent oxidoreductase [Lewinellaceae bacterium]
MQYAVKPWLSGSKFLIPFWIVVVLTFTYLRPDLTAQPVKEVTIPVIIAGGGASGTMAAIQCARQGVSCVLVEPTSWLGGMLTSGGVSAFDGNHQLPSGLWGELRDSIYNRYGGPAMVSTGWVSNTLFEPSAGNAILQNMVHREKGITLLLQSEIKEADFDHGQWHARIQTPDGPVEINSSIFIDATELGDWAASMGVSYRLGMDSKYDTGEKFAPEIANDIIQDLTYVLTLKDYGPDADRTILPPPGYDPEMFRCSCSPAGQDPKPYIDCQQMLAYGKLPGNKYMINWPRCGNDYYLNAVDLEPDTRMQPWKGAKNKSLGFLYYLQTELGYKNLGLDEMEYPTSDHLPLIPYYRESRRIKGLAFLRVDDIMNPYDQPRAYYRAGIAVGDYPIDHHHGERPDAPRIDFINIKVPSFNIPMGCLIPESVRNLIVAEKSISVSNIVNGATRLQPVVLEIGQAAGVLAAVAVAQNKAPADVSIRQVQQSLLNAGAYIMPFIDIPSGDPHFQAIQKAGATGLLKGHGVPFKWADQTWFYPENYVSEFEFIDGIRDYYPSLLHQYNATGEPLTLLRFIEFLKELSFQADMQRLTTDWQELKLSGIPSADTLLTRRMLAVLANQYLKLFERPIDHEGRVLETTP